MGTVYLAVRDDDAFHKRVALKVLKRGMDTDSIVRRFRTERQILAGLDHPNIARLLDGGTTSDGRPYLVMEYVDGAPLVEYRRVATCSTPTRGSTCSCSWPRRRAVRAPEPGHPPRHQAGQRAGHATTASQAARLRHRQAAQSRDGRADDGADGGGAAPDDARVRQPRAGARRDGDHRQRRLLARRAALRAAHRHAGPTASPAAPWPTSPAWCAKRSRRRRAWRSARRPRRGAGPPRHAGTTRARAPVHRPADTRSAAATARRRSRQHRAQGAQQGAGAPLRLGRSVRRGRATAPAPDCRCWPGTTRSATGPRSSCAATAARSLRRRRSFWRWSPDMVGVAWQARVARAERARAEQRFDDLRALANAFLFDVHERHPQPGGLDAGAPAGGAEGHRVPRQAGRRRRRPRPTFAASWPPATCGSAMSRAVRFNPNLGDTAGALANYRKSVGLYESLGDHRGEPRRPAARDGHGPAAAERAARRQRRQPGGDAGGAARRRSAA